MNLRELRQLSAKHELSLNFIAKDQMLSKALYQLQGNPDIVLKGGTAINRIYLKRENIMRFSEDIDLDIDSKQTIKKTITKTDKIVKKIEGFEIAKPRIMNQTIRYDLHYTNPLGHKDKIRLEFNVREIKEKHGKEIINFGFVPYESALLETYNKEVLIKHKLECLTSRKEGKDIYDLHALLKKGFKVKRELAKKSIEALNMDEKEIKNIANASNHHIPKQLRPDWHTLIEELKKILKKNLRKR